VSDDNVKPIPVKFKAPPGDDEPFLKVISSVSNKDSCNHRYRWIDDPRGSEFGTKQVSATYMIREGETEIECGLCHTKLDPMFVLKFMANEENSWSHMRARYLDEMKRLNARSRTRCYHCGKMTEISRS
jgi:hypothetical protein